MITETSSWFVLAVVTWWYIHTFAKQNYYLLFHIWQPGFELWEALRGWAPNKRWDPSFPRQPGRNCCLVWGKCGPSPLLLLGAFCCSCLQPVPGLPCGFSLLPPLPLLPSAPLRVKVKFKSWCQQGSPHEIIKQIKELPLLFLHGT